jgi:hypothetical protein
MTIITRNDARLEKQAADARLFAKEDARIAEQNRVAEILKANPHIGMIVRKGKPMFYTGVGENMTRNIDELAR